MSAVKQSTPFLIFNPADELLQGKCETKFVTPDMVQVVDGRNADPGYLDSKDEYDQSIVPKGDKNPQHSMVIVMPACSLVQAPNDLIRFAQIQEGTDFKCVVKKKKMTVTLLPQSVPPPIIKPQGAFKDRFERVVVPKDEYEKDDPNTIFKSVKEVDLIRVNNNVTRFFSFKVTFDKECEAPDEDSYCIFCQIHQGGGGPPPLSFRLKQGGPGLGSQLMGQIQLYAADQLSYTELIGKLERQYKRPDGGKVIERTGFALTRGVEYQFKIEFNAMNATIKGVKQKAPPLRIWMNDGGEDKLIYEENVFWGYTINYPTVSENHPNYQKLLEKALSNTRLNIKVGIYRRRHGRLQSVTLGIAKYGPTLKSVR